ncbi:hypothetical protein BDR07DRAFT_1425855 [Suillus spraguei]|nr:hypothetical protein BDR07DRAFT_1425855 [Suillus spraguei]
MTFFFFDNKLRSIIRLNHLAAMPPTVSPRMSNAEKKLTQLLLGVYIYMFLSLVCA